MKDAVKEILGSLLFFAIVFGGSALCCICSGYHWE